MACDPARSEAEAPAGLHRHCRRDDPASAAAAAGLFAHGAGHRRSGLCADLSEPDSRDAAGLWQSTCTGADRHADGLRLCRHHADASALRAVCRSGRAGLLPALSAPVSGADEDYFIATANETFAATADSVQTASAKTLGTVTAGKTTCTATYSTGLDIGTLPNTVNTSGGKQVDVYLWFEGEDTNCMSDNLAAALDAYDIDISIKDAGLDTY